MSLKDVVSAISIEHGIPASKVRLVTNSFLMYLAKTINNKEIFNSPIMRMKVVEKPQKEIKDSATGEVKVVPSRLVGLLTVKPPKE